MPKRPIQHIIGEKAELCLRKALPEKWVISGLSPDYAKDFLAEVVSEDGELQGLHFLIQLKGTNSLRASGSFVLAPIDIEHVRYYQRRVQLPVLIALADVASEKVYYEFVQPSVASGAQTRSRKRANTGTVQFRIPASQEASMHARLLESLKQAFRFMRTQYPGPPNAAVEARRRELEQLDPRFEYSIRATSGREEVAIRPKTPVTFRTSFHGTPEVVQQRLKNFVERGEPLIADEEFSIKVHGLPALEAMDGDPIRLELTRHREFEFSITAAESPGAKEYSLPTFRGGVIGGTREARMDWAIERCPIRGCAKFTFDPAGPMGTLTLNHAWDISPWRGLPMVTLPWLDQVHSFLKAASSPSAVISVRLSTDGNVLIDESRQFPDNFAAIAGAFPLVEELRKCREVCRLLNLDYVLPDSLTDGDIDDINELYPLVTEGKAVGPPQSIGFSVTGPDAEKMVEQLGSHPGAAITARGGIEAVYNFLRGQFDFSEVESRFSDWTRIEFKSNGTALGGGTVVLHDCVPTRVWPKYLRTAD